jgi:hypothetical protein
LVSASFLFEVQEARTRSRIREMELCQHVKIESFDSGVVLFHFSVYLVHISYLF